MSKFLPELSSNQRTAVALADEAMHLIALSGMYPEDVVDAVASYLEAEAGEAGKIMGQLLRDIQSGKVTDV